VRCDASALTDAKKSAANFRLRRCSDGCLVVWLFAIVIRFSRRPCFAADRAAADP
jgi:hypothetical protein